MKLLIKQRVFSWTDTYSVYDEYENEKYFVKAKALAIGHQIYIYDTYGNEVGSIHEKFFTFMPQFDIIIAKQFMGSIKKRFTFMRSLYDININNWRIEGDFLGWNYDIISGSKIIMNIQKKPFNWGDTYVIDIDCQENELLGLITVIAIDAANCSK